MVEHSPAESPMLNRAASAFKAGQLVEAEQLALQVIAARPDFFEAVHLLTSIQSSLGKHDLALTTCDCALGLQPGNAVIHCDRANILSDLGRYDEAVASYDRALALRPDFARAYYNRGNVLLEQNRYQAAIESFDRGLALRPDNAVAHSNRGNALQKLKRFEEAVASYDRALQLRPNLVDALSNRGAALQSLYQFDEALRSYDRAIALQPNYAGAHFNRGTALLQLKLHEDAVASFDRALAAKPDFADAYLNRGNATQALGQYDEALASYEGAYKARPDYADAYYNEALCRLLVGDFDRGWEKYEWRWQVDQLQDSKRSFPQPLWLGQSDIAGQTILLYCEQGFGDTIQFSRYAPLVAERGARVILDVQGPLETLMTGLAGTTQVVTKGSALPDFDLQCPLLSLPLAFKTRLETIPPVVPGLRAPPQTLEKWDARLGSKNRPRIGLAWSGRPTHVNDRNRSIRLATLLPLLELDATFVSLQKDVRRVDAALLEERGDLLHFGNEIGDFSDTAALISNLDLIVSVDTSVVHLAGALGKPAWVMLPFIPDWRWLRDREDSPWYPTVRLFRQDATHKWDSMIPRVQAALRDFIQRTTKNR